MSKFIEILAMALGGLSLFAVCFLGFTLASGKSLSDVPGLGGMVVEPDAEGAVDGEPDAPTASRPQPAGPRTPHDIVQSSIGVMGAWGLPSPFTQVELKQLTDELKARRLELEDRERALEEREADVADRLAAIDERFDLLDRMREDLEAYERELELREQEVLRDEKARNQRVSQTWADRAVVFRGLDKNSAGVKMLDYEPAEAAQILHAMDPTEAAEILQAIPERWKEYLDAYASFSPQGERP